MLRLYSADGSNADLCRRKIIESGKRMAIPESDGVDELELGDPEVLENGKWNAIGNVALFTEHNILNIATLK